MKNNCPYFKKDGNLTGCIAQLSSKPKLLYPCWSNDFLSARHKECPDYIKMKHIKIKAILK